MKIDREGQSAVLSDADYAKIRKQITSRKYKLLWDLAWYTGERWGALVQLRVADVYNEDGTPREYINFRARTRKAKPKKSTNSTKPKQLHKNRQVPTHPILKELLETYQLDSDSPWLFPNRTGDKSIGLRWADKILRSAVERASLGNRGISTHSTRRSFITNLANRGGSLAKIKSLTGHTDLKVLARYVEVTDDDLRSTIALL